MLKKAEKARRMQEEREAARLYEEYQRSRQEEQARQQRQRDLDLELRQLESEVARATREAVQENRAVAADPRTKSRPKDEPPRDAVKAMKPAPSTD